MGHGLTIVYGLPLARLPDEYAKYIETKYSNIDSEDLPFEITFCLEDSLTEFLILAFNNPPKEKWDSKWEYWKSWFRPLSELKTLPEFDTLQHWKRIEELEPKLLEYKHLFDWYVCADFY